MGKQYEDKLVSALKQRQKVEDYHGAPVLVKYLPDCDERGAMDPRLYRDQKKALKMMAWMPSFLMKMDTSPKGIANLRKMFNGIKSVPCVDAPIQIEKRTVPAEDGYEIPIRIYKANREDAGKAILYYIHGGGGFGGSPDVVEHDFLKLETLGYGVKLHRAGVETKMVLYKGFGHAYFDNAGVYPQTEDCIDEMAAFVSGLVAKSQAAE